LNPLNRINVTCSDDVRVETERRTRITVTQLALSDRCAFGIHEHACQAVTESMKANATALPLNAQLV
jgi:hypothetical protein